MERQILVTSLNFKEPVADHYCLRVRQAEIDSLNRPAAEPALKSIDRIHNDPFSRLICRETTEGWAAEAKDFDFVRPRWRTGAEHFSQLVRV